MITVEEYNQRTKEDMADFKFSPVYGKYRSKKVRDYSECECCDHRDFIGWKEVTIPVGEPIGYEKRRKDMMDYVLEDWGRSLEQSMNSTIDSLLGDKVYFPRIGGDDAK